MYALTLLSAADPARATVTDLVPSACPSMSEIRLGSTGSSTPPTKLYANSAPIAEPFGVPAIASATDTSDMASLAVTFTSPAVAATVDPTM